MSLLDKSKLKVAYNQITESLAGDSSFQTGVIRVRTNLLKNVKSQAQVGGFGGKGYDKSHTFYCDEREHLGGGNEAPAPLEYFVAGLNLSLQNTCIFWAIKDDVDIKSFEIQSYVYFNRLGVYDGGDPAITKITCEVSIESDSNATKVEKLLETAAEHSVAYSAFSKIAPIDRRVIVNGKETRQSETEYSSR